MSVTVHSAVDSVQRSSPRTTKGPRTRPDQTDLGLDCSPDSTLVLSVPVLVLKISGMSRTSPSPYLIGVIN